MGDRRGRYLREAGRLRLADGSDLVWSVAEGRRGRRWRAVASFERAITHALLLEIDLAGRPARLELATPAGMLTLHPEPDEAAIHGNVVSGAGVRPLAFPWSRDHEFDVVGRPIALSIGLHRRRHDWPIGGVVSLAVLAIDAGLLVAPGRRTVTRLDERRWRIVDPESATAAERTLALDADGLPVSDERWPLEP